MRISALLLGGIATAAIGFTGACASPPTARNEPGGLQFSNSTVAPRTAPVRNYREAYETAHRFATIWVRKDIERSAWQTQLSELATSELKKRIETAGFPQPTAATLRGDIAPRVSRPDRIEFVVDTDDGVQAIVTVPEGTQWRIAAIQPA